MACIDGGILRADRDDSALVRSVKLDRMQAVANFHFMPQIAMWSLTQADELGESAIEAFQSAPMSTIRFRETHICPVGEECPAEIVVKIGERRRCGICPIALKCIDHKPAIAAKRHALIERIKYLTVQKEYFESRKDLEAAEAIWEELDLDTNELLGWQLSEEILDRILNDVRMKEGDNGPLYYAERPDIVRLHLRRRVQQTSQTEFLLRRIIEADAYPSLQSPQIQAVASLIRRRLLAGKHNEEIQIPAPDDVAVSAKLLRTIMTVNRLSLSDVAGLLDGTDSLTSPIEAPLLLIADGDDEL